MKLSERFIRNDIPQELKLEIAAWCKEDANQEVVQLIQALEYKAAKYQQLYGKLMTDIKDAIRKQPTIEKEKQYETNN